MIDDVPTTKTVKTIERIFVQLKLNPVGLQPWFITMKTLIDALEAGQTDLTILADNFLEFGFEVVRAQPGWEDYPTSPILRQDSRNNELFTIADGSHNGMAAIAENTGPAVSFFNQFTAKAHARGTILLSEANDRLNAKIRIK
jgi:hypothetical protein